MTRGGAGSSYRIAEGNQRTPSRTLGGGRGEGGRYGTSTIFPNCARSSISFWALAASANGRI
jgi:hypothetical protein